jgi:hypothetical protein
MILKTPSEQEQRKIQLEQILVSSGSNFAFDRQNPNVVVPNKEHVASSLLFKSLSKNKINQEELLKSVATEITELRPTLPEPPALDLVPRSLLDEQSNLTNSLQNEIGNLSQTIADLQSQIAGLLADSSTKDADVLAIGQTNTVLANQIDTLSKTIEDLSNQIQNSIQKSIEESILRASLQSQNMGYKSQIEALVKQIDSLNSIIEGLQSQLGSIQQQQAITQASQNIALVAGGDLINEVVIVKAEPTSTPPESSIVGRINNLTGEFRWEWGQTLFVTNNDLNPVTVTITVFNPLGQNWLSCPKNVLQLTPGVAEELLLIFTPGACTYTAGDFSKTFLSNVRISVKRRDGTEKAKNIETKINIMHPDAY